MELEQLTELEERRYIKGEILFTIYENEADQFTIAKIKIHDTNEEYEEKEIVGKGYFANLQPGIIYQFFGSLDRHPSFGIQYKVDSYQTYVPKTTEGLIHYLSSDLDRKSTRLNSSHVAISYAVFCLKKKTLISRTDNDT